MTLPQSLLLLLLLLLRNDGVHAFLSPTNRGRKEYPTSLQINSLWDSIGNVWEEVIEMSTYGPSERKLLKRQRERQKQQNGSLNEDDLSDASSIEYEDDRAWMEAFAAAKKNTNEGDTEESSSLEFDGYALRDLLIEKWGVPLDVDFQYRGNNIYCTILPMLGYSPSIEKSRHISELEYLMHLQGVVEVLHKYDNLVSFIAFVETTNKIPKRGTDSVPFLMTISPQELKSILKNIK